MTETVYLNFLAAHSASLADGPVDVQKWVQILPLGKPRMNDGRELEVDRSDLDTVLADLGTRESEVPILYEHGKGPRGGVAAGWFTRFEVRETGLWGLVKWTAEAASEIRAQLWKYLSPGFWGRIVDDVIRPTSLFEASLTNVPAIDGMAPVEAEIRVAREEPTKDDLKTEAAVEENPPAAAPDPAPEPEKVEEKPAPSVEMTVSAETVTREEFDTRVRAEAERLAQEMAVRAEKATLAAVTLEAGIKSGRIPPAKRDVYTTLVNAFPVEMAAVIEDLHVRVSTKSIIKGTAQLDLQSGAKGLDRYTEAAKRAKRDGLTIEAALNLLR